MKKSDQERLKKMISTWEKLMQRQEHQVNQGIEGIYRNDEDERNQAFQRLESMRRKVDNLDYEAELAAYREEYLL